MNKKYITPTIKTEWLTIYPNLGVDTCAGERINQGSLMMQMHGGTATIDHKGRKVEIGIGLSGCTLTLSAPSRQCTLNVSRFIDQAIADGLLEPVLDFPKPEGK